MPFNHNGVRKMRKSRRSRTGYSLWKARRNYDRSQIDRRTRLGRIAISAMQKRGRKSPEEREALAAVGYPGY